jgi:hypothetical protein
MGTAIGFDGVFKVSGKTDTPASVTMVEMTGVRDVSINVSMDTAEVSDRTSAYKLYAQGMVDLETSVEVTYNTDNEQLIDCLETCRDRGTIKIQVLDDAGAGYSYWAMCTSTDINQPLTDGMTVSLTFKPHPTYDSSGDLDPPEWV